ncbi:MAG: hypothetical protein WAS33_22175 [Candidatus Promineifilaceae bacterium]|nr:hypothetical protein [Anaerolineaceae bacterium]
MNKESRSNTVLIVALVAAGCLLLLCVAMLLVIFMFGISPFTVEETPVETTTLTEAQLAQCREVMAILPDVELEGEYYLYRPGFLDDSLECHLLARSDSLEDLFDTAVINPNLTTDQEIAPGRHLRLEIERIEQGVYRINGYWYQT